MKYLYSPPPPEGWGYWLERGGLGHFMPILFVFLALFIVYKHQEYKQVRNTVSYIVVFIVSSITAYNLIISEIRADRTKYKIYVDNSAALETFSGVIESVGTQYRVWPGHSFSKYGDDYLWPVFTVRTRDDEWGVIWHIQTREAFDMTKPPCFKGDIYGLLSPYVGKEIKLSYFSFISSYHDTSSRYSKCVVDIQVEE